MTLLIPLHDKNGNVVQNVLISQEDAEIVTKYKWHKKNNKYAQGNVNGHIQLMHHLIMGKPEKGYVVDHINHNTYDNRRENLRFATRSQNSQNTSRQTNEYFGIYFDSRDKKWQAKCKHYSLGRYDAAIDAAKAYDRGAYVIFGNGAKTNGLVSYEDCQNLRCEDVIKTKKSGLPKNIYKDGTKYVVKMMKNKKTLLSSYFGKIEEAKDYLLNIQNQKKMGDEVVRKSQEITRNCEGSAIIQCDKIDAIVDDDLWHELSKYQWNIKYGYLYGTINNQVTYMHRYIIHLKGYDLNVIDERKCVVDHINHVRHDNRYINLRINTASGNSHNRQKKTTGTSQYIGVDYAKNKSKWRARISIEYKHQHIGYYVTEIEAAQAYNQKAIELYGSCAHLNNIDTHKQLKIKLLLKKPSLASFDQTITPKIKIKLKILSVAQHKSHV